MADEIPLSFVVTALRQRPGTKVVMLNGKPTTVSADPAIQARALAAMKYLDDQAAADSARRASGDYITPDEYANLGPANRP